MSDLHGIVYTKDWIVNLVLDLAGYTIDKPLWRQVIVEPACGNGSFLKAIVKRLIASAAQDGKVSCSYLQKCIISYDLDQKSIEQSRAAIINELTYYDISEADAKILAMHWVKHGDYLLSETTKCDYIIGNPPYLKAIEIPQDIRKVYCSRLSTMTMGSDIFIGFIQKGLESLKYDTGVLCFICADRWMQNQYGRKLRKFVAQYYHIDTIVKMHGVSAFETNVSAYPAIIRIDYGAGDIKYIDCNKKFSESDINELQCWINGKHIDYNSKTFSGTLLSQPLNDNVIPLASPEKVRVITNLAHRFPVLESTGVKLGVGLATGRDSVFIVYDSDLVEPDRMLPAFNMKDWRSGNQHKACWIVNPWNTDGTLVKLSDYPKMERYFDKHKSNIMNRHIAKKNVRTWYRTIDKVNWEIYGTPMLLFPDIAMKATPIYCDGTRYPCHNCYWLVSDRWDIKVLGGLLMSDIAEAFVDALGVKMEGGAMRFQAQYLRLIHVPNPEELSKDTSIRLRIAFENNDRDAANKAALAAYGLEEKI